MPPPTSPGDDLPNFSWLTTMMSPLTQEKFGKSSPAAVGELLLVDHHDVAAAPHLVRVPAFAHADPADDARRPRVGDVDDGGARGRPHVADIQRRALGPHLSTPGAA